MKIYKFIFITAILSSLTACSLQPISVINKKLAKFQYTGNYVTADKTEKHYYQTLSIMPIANSKLHYQVNFSASKVRGRANCAFSGTATEKNGILWLNISNEANKNVTMYIRPNNNKSGVEVFTKKFAERFYMMRYCRGGGSLAGDYLRVLSNG